MPFSVERARHVLGLDLVRFWAASTVVAFHLAFWSWVSPDNLTYRAAGGSVRFAGLEPFTWFGWLGVETFFVISGFVICVSAEHATPYQFLRGRIARLYPAVWICATVTAFVSLSLNLSPAAQLAVEYLRSMVIFFSTGPWIDGVYRTLIPEGVFYALVLSLLMIGRFRHTEAVAMLLGAYSFSFWIVGLFGWVAFRPGVWFYFSKNAVFFALGMMIWVIRRSGPSLSRLAVLGLLTSGGALEVHFVSLQMVVHADAIVAVLVWLASIASILLAVFLNERISDLVGARASLFKLMGRMTYPLYLIHDVVGGAVLRSSAVVGQRVALALAVLLSFAFAYAVVRAEPIIRRPLLIGLDALQARVIRGSEVLRHAIGLIFPARRASRL